MNRNTRKAAPAREDAVADAIRSVRGAASMRRFLGELLTPAERRTLALRWQLLGMLVEGVPQRLIGQRLGVSLCKITRGSRILKEPGSVIRRMLRRRGRRRPGGHGWMAKSGTVKRGRFR